MCFLIVYEVETIVQYFQQITTEIITKISANILKIDAFSWELLRNVRNFVPLLMWDHLHVLSVTRHTL